VFPLSVVNKGGLGVEVAPAVGAQPVLFTAGEFFIFLSTAHILQYKHPLGTVCDKHEGAGRVGLCRKGIYGEYLHFKLRYLHLPSLLNGRIS
jgi:hypothetical protein